MKLETILEQLKPAPQDLPDEINAKTFLYILEKLKLLGINATYTYSWGIYDPELNKVVSFHTVVVSIFTKEPERLDEFTVFFENGKCILNYSPNEEDTEYIGSDLTIVETITKFTAIIEKILTEIVDENEQKISLIKGGLV